MHGVEDAEAEARYRWLVVANDAEDSVIGRLAELDVDWIDHRNPDPSAYYIDRVYAAWNRGVLESRTQAVVMLNSDMYPSPHWLDELMDVRAQLPRSVPTSLLIESGRLPSAIPECVENFGTRPETFRRNEFRVKARDVRRRSGHEPGRLYMPILVMRDEFFDVGGYPRGNPPGTTGDKDLIRRYKEAGFDHVMAMGSVVYHVQEGEMRA